MKENKNNKTEKEKANLSKKESKKNINKVESKKTKVTESKESSKVKKTASSSQNKKADPKKNLQNKKDTPKEAKKIAKGQKESKLKKVESENILTKTIKFPLSLIKRNIKDDTYEKRRPTSEAVKKYKKKHEKHLRSKRKFNGRLNLDIFSILIIIITVAFIASVSTCVIINYQFRKSTNLINRQVVNDKNVQDFLNTYSEIVDNYYEEIDKEGMMAAAMSGMLDYLKDNYSIYLNENESEDLSESLDGSYNGLGILIRGTIIEDVYKNSPAEEAGLKIGDELISINNNPISLENYDKVGDYLDKENENIITVKRSKDEMTFKVKVNNVYVPATSSNIIKSPDKKKSIGYINLSTFSLMAYEDFKDSLTELEEKKIDSLIIDLRNNTGGYLNVATNISNLFLEKDKIIYSLENKNKITAYKDETAEKRDYKIAILVNGGTASAAEILATALHDSYGASIIGQRTYGKGKVQTMKYYEGTIVKYTSAKWLRPNGDCIDEVGIEPDYEVSLVVENNTIYDKQLDKAIELLSK